MAFDIHTMLQKVANKIFPIYFLYRYIQTDIPLHTYNEIEIIENMPSGLMEIMKKWEIFSRENENVKKRVKNLMKGNTKRNFKAVKSKKDCSGREIFLLWMTIWSSFVFFSLPNVSCYKM